jgi:hypothetical protein
MLPSLCFSATNAAELTAIPFALGPQVCTTIRSAGDTTPALHVALRPSARATVTAVADNESFMPILRIARLGFSRPVSFLPSTAVAVEASSLRRPMTRVRFRAHGSR